mgnify:FL=1
MKKLLGILLAGLIGIGIAVAAELQQYQAGPRLIDGTQLNLMVDQVNNLTGNGTPGAVTGTTGTFSGAFTLTGTAASSGVTCATYLTGTNVDVDRSFFIATRAFRVVATSAVFGTTNGAALTLQVTKDTGTNAPGAGTDLLTAAFDLNLTANTVQVGSLVTTAGFTTLAAGDRLSVDFSTTRTNLVGLTVTACLAPL